MLTASIITISYNQYEYLVPAVESVLGQGVEGLEFIVVDPGSTDGSREYLETRRDRLKALVLDPDKGPADGLNKGFALATGDILGYLNSDDLLYPGALASALRHFEARPEVDVLSGHAYIIDGAGEILRRSYSMPFKLREYAYGACVVNQPSTFFRRACYEKTAGFNIENRSNWDGELWVDMALAGARFAVVEEFWSGYRLHEASITASAKLDRLMREYEARIFERIMGRPRNGSVDPLLSRLYKLRRFAFNPRFLVERLRNGPIYGRLSSKAA